MVLRLLIVLCLQAYCYHGQTLLASDKCGEAIRSLQEAEKCTYMYTVCMNYSMTLHMLLHNNIKATNYPSSHLLLLMRCHGFSFPHSWFTLRLPSD